MMKNKGKLAAGGGILIFILLLVLIIWYQGKEENLEPISRTDYMLNTVVNVKIYDKREEVLLDGAMEICRKYEDLFSPTLNSSEIYSLNHGELKETDGFYSLSPDTADLISKALDYCRLSEGAFDISIEPVSSLWDFTSGQGLVPDEASIQAALPLVNYKNIVLEGEKIRFQQEGMGINLGAIAKGYIADKMKEYLQSQGVESAIIDLGGNILCLGGRPDGTPFSIGIRKPFGETSETAAIMEISDKSVVSSGIYERYFEKDGILYHHILDPDTGYPYENNLVSVTIISDKSVDGDGLSTTCFALGLEKGMDLINSLPQVQAVFITKDYEMHYSENFRQEISLKEQ